MVVIKSIFDEEDTDAKEKKRGKSSSTTNAFNPPLEPSGSEKTSGQPSEPSPASKNEPAAKPQDNSANADEKELEERLAGIQAELDALRKTSESGEAKKEKIQKEEPDTPSKPVAEDRTDAVNTGSESKDQYPETVPESKAETLRKSGLAYSAAIALFGSVIFMLILGWFADLLLGIKPWGTVIGIALGSIIGFFQFFRITSQIFAPKPTDFERVSLFGKKAEPEDKAVETASLPDQVGVLNTGGQEPVLDGESKPEDANKVPKTDAPADE